MGIEMKMILIKHDKFSQVVLDKGYLGVLYPSVQGPNTLTNQWFIGIVINLVDLFHIYSESNYLN